VSFSNELEDVVEEFERKGGEMIDLFSTVNEVSGPDASIEYPMAYLLKFFSILSSRL
jgi:hypothetical protein